MTQGYTLSADSIRQLKKVVREWYALWKNEQAAVPYYGQVRDTRRWAILDADLLAAVDMFADPSTATAHLIDRKANGDLEVTDEYWTDAEWLGFKQRAKRIVHDQQEIGKTKLERIMNNPRMKEQYQNSIAREMKVIMYVNYLTKHK